MSDIRHDRDGTATGTGEATKGEFEWSAVAPSTAVVETIASAADCDPTELDPLYNAIDTDALDRLLDSGEPNGMTTVTFRVGGYEVTVQRGGTVIARPIETATEPE